MGYNEMATDFEQKRGQSGGVIIFKDKAGFTDAESNYFY